MKFYFNYIPSTVKILSNMQEILKNSQTTKIFMVFFEGVTVRHPLTVYSPNHFWFSNRFSMKKRQKTDFYKSFDT